MLGPALYLHNSGTQVIMIYYLILKESQNNISGDEIFVLPKNEIIAPRPRILTAQVDD